jgi:soluble lytic murein transglycosylase-like protein
VSRILPTICLSAVALWLWSSSAEAALYRCTGKQGETAFTSSRAGYTQCTPVHVPAPNAAPATPSTPAPAASNAPPPAAPPATSQARVEFRSATGGDAPVAATGSDNADRVTRGAVYKYIKDGVTHYTNRRPAGQRAQVLFTYIESCFACNPTSGVDFSNVALNAAAFGAEIAAAAAMHGVDPAFVRAIIHAESAFNPNAISRVGAQGLMQLMPDTADRFGVVDPFVPAQNIDGGTRYLAWLMKRFDGDTRLVAAAYNAGEGAVDKYAGVPPYDETMVFVERVGTLHERYRGTPVAAVAAGGNAPQLPPTLTGEAVGSPMSRAAR